MQFEAVGPADRVAALEILFQRLPAAEARPRICSALELLERGDVASVRLLAAREHGCLAGSVLMQALPGAIGVLWPPQGGSPAIEDSLTRQALDWLHSRGVKVTQVLLAPKESALAGGLLRNGFVRATQMCYLTHDLEVPPRWLAVPERGQWCTFRACPKGVFRDTLFRTYEGTLDFPELNGVLTEDDVLAGLRSGLDRPEDTWWLVDEGTGPAGVMLLEKTHASHCWDLAYMGVVPEARRCGWGRELVVKAVFEAKAGDATELTVSVDARNTPAMNLYRRLGFVEYDRRDVYLHLKQG